MRLVDVIGQKVLGSVKKTAHTSRLPKHHEREINPSHQLGFDPYDNSLVHKYS